MSVPKKQGHTPGPWDVGNGIEQPSNRPNGRTRCFVPVFAQSGREVARSELFTNPDVEAPANAALIAAAPDGLDANHAALTVLAMVAHGKATPEHIAAAIAKLEAAIVKAEGRS